MGHDRDILADRPPSLPAESRLSLDAPHRREILDAHSAALEQGADGYIDPSSGLFVLSARYLAARGYCCEQGCRHCPYVEK
ncbi:MAG: DUF5522 domain-containing protein [Acidimicrobiales bacterium]